jgi:hypothetical protein
MITDLRASRNKLVSSGLLAAAAVALVTAAPAGASAKIGQTSAASEPCTLGNLLFQASTAAGPGYTVPPGGEAITSWSTQAGNYIGSMKLQIVRPLGGTQYTVVAESPPQDLLPNHLNTFALSPPLRVRAGDMLGLTQTGGTPACAFGPGTFGLVAPGDTLLRTDTGIDPPIGMTFTRYGDVAMTRLNVSATVDAAPAGPAAAPAASSPPAAATTSFGGARLVSHRLRFGGGYVAVELRCPAGSDGGCSGRTELRARRRALGRARFSTAAGTRDTVLIRVSPAGRRLLAAARHLAARSTTVTRDGAGRSATTAAAVTIRG